jgi:hypothetical protein
MFNKLMDVARRWPDGFHRQMIIGGFLAPISRSDGRPKVMFNKLMDVARRWPDGFHRQMIIGGIP